MKPLSSLLPFIFQEEGGYSTTRTDPGNWSSGRVNVGTFIGTNHGISAPTLIAWYGHRVLVTAKVMENLSLDEAASIYATNYAHPIKCDELTGGPDLMTLNVAVTSGPAESVRLLQETLGSPINGVVDESTLDLLLAVPDVPAFVEALYSRHSSFYRSLSGFRVSGQQWLERLGRCRDTSKLRAQPPLVTL